MRALLTTPLDQGEDLRVRRTRRLLADALVALALERPFEEITIRELTDRAAVGYATFFRHYKSKDELLRAMLQDVLGELLELLGPAASVAPRDAGTQLFHHAATHANLYRLLFRGGRSSNLLQEAERVGVRGVYETFEAKPGSRVPLEVAAQHLVGSLMRLLGWWLDHDQPYPPERMGEIYQDLILGPLEGAALRRREVGPRDA